jgi:cell division protein ZapB
MIQPDLQSLEVKIDALIEKCHQLAQENQALRENQATLISEKTILEEKNTQARNRIESMISRLKAVEMTT